MTNSTSRVMTVQEMGKMLGLKEATAQSLASMGLFEVRRLFRQKWVLIDSFEKWYANQTYYRKVNGEPPGQEISKQAYSVQDIADMLGIHRNTAYRIIKINHFDQIKVDSWRRVPRETFMKWYEGQNHYRIASVREKDAPIEAASISRTQMRELLGVTKSMVTGILESRKYKDCLEIVQVGDTKRVTKTSFIRFLCMQDKYRLIEDPPPGGILPAYLSLEEAAKAAGISRQAVSGYAAAGCFPQIKTKGIVRIPRSDFQKWLKSRLTGQFTIHAPQEGENGIDQKTRKNIQRHLQLPGRPGQEKAEMGNLQDQRGGHAPQEGDRI